MWLFTRSGFYSIANRSGRFHVRARSRADLQTLKRVVGIEAPIIGTPDGDYRARLIVGREELDAIMRFLAESVNYDDFKGTIAGVPDQSDKLDAYFRVWMAMRLYQDRIPKENAQTSSMIGEP